MKEIDLTELEYHALKEVLENMARDESFPVSDNDNANIIEELRKLQKEKLEEYLKPVIYSTTIYEND